MSNYVLLHNIFREASLVDMIDVNDMIDSIQSEIYTAEYQVSMGEDPHIQVGEMRKAIDLSKLFLDYLWARWSLEFSLENIGDLERKRDCFEERAGSPVVESDIEDNLEAAKELSQNLSVMIDRLVLDEANMLIAKREYLYACVEQVDPLNGQLARIYEIELLEEEIQRSLV